MQQPMQSHGSGQASMYMRLLLMMALSFLSMYALMYAMVDRFDHVYGSLNQVYMAALMAAPMLVFELVLMGAMYDNKVRNRVLVGVGVAATVLFWMLIRQQTAINDRQFLRSMIPHHAGAILMCEQASIKDPAIQRLCVEIVVSQRKEIAQMQALLDRNDVGAVSSP